MATPIFKQKSFKYAKNLLFGDDVILVDIEARRYP